MIFFAMIPVNLALLAATFTGAIAQREVRIGCNVVILPQASAPSWVEACKERCDANYIECLTVHCPAIPYFQMCCADNHLLTQSLVSRTVGFPRKHINAVFGIPVDSDSMERDMWFDIPS